MTGYFYALQLSPDVAPQRVKLGWTADTSRRIAAHRTTCPTARTLGTWRCARAWERWAIRFATHADCRKVRGEVFDCGDVNALTERLRAFFAEHDAEAPDVPRLTVPQAVSPIPLASSDAVAQTWLTIAEATELLKVGQETVRRWLRDGKLRGVLLSDRGGYRMTRAEVDRFIREELGWSE